MTPQQFNDNILPLKDKMYRFACRLVEDAEEAQDLVQEVFVRLWDRKGDIQQYKSIEAYALTMTRNLCIDWLRTSGRLRMDDPTEMDLADPVTPYDLTEMRDTVIRINHLISHLPEQQKVILHLRDIEGYDFDEIAAILGLNLNVIRVNLSRARKKIKEQLVKVHQYDLQRN
jgi:RNA polymerase sigma-70 factor (ECF subfamily)